jgi:hypothetical protein
MQELSLLADNELIELVSDALAYISGGEGTDVGGFIDPLG